MVLQLLVGAVYELVQQSWTVSALLVKFFLIGVLIKQLQERQFQPEKYMEEVYNLSPVFVSLIVFLASIKSLAAIEIELLLPVLSELTAWLYFLYLFWRY